MRCKNPAQHAISMSGASERSLQIASRNVDRCENAGRSGEDRRRGSASMERIPAAQGHRGGVTATELLTLAGFRECRKTIHGRQWRLPSGILAVIERAFGRNNAAGSIQIRGRETGH
jgi:hypothetical protein